MVRFFGRAAYHGDPELAESLVQPIAKIMLVSVQRILHKAAARGEIRPEVDLEATGRVLNTLMLAVGDAQLFPHLNDYFQLSDEGMPTEQVVDALLDMVMKGIT
jgi:hypothetical protein